MRISDWSSDVCSSDLPEYPGSGRNWDYRFCWLRDSYYVITALNHIGQFEEMELYANYITNITHADTGRLQPLYGINGQRSEERRVGKECVSTCRSRWAPYH